MTGEPAATDIGSRADVSADAALVLAAVMRMQEADRQTRETLERLRTGLAEMAAAIGRAKAKIAVTDDSDAAAKAVDTAAMLDELEHRVDRMIEIAAGESGDAAAVADTAQLAMEPPPPAGEAPTTEAAAMAAAKAANIDQVPTVSGVVSRLDPEQETAEPAAPSARDMAIAAAAAGPTVEMLKSLVEALNASIPAESFGAHRMGELSAIPATAEAAAQEVIQAFARELTRGGAADIPSDGATNAVAVEAPEPDAVEAPAAAAAETPEVAAVEGSIQDAQAALDAQPDTADHPEPLVFDVLVEFDPVAPRPEARTEARTPEARTEARTEAVEPAAEHVATISPSAEAEPAESLIESVLDSFEASFEDIAAAPQPAAAAPAEPVEAALSQSAETAPAEPASTDAQPAYPSPTNNVVIHEVELLARFEQMEAVPILPPELGTAVIFQPRHALTPATAAPPAPPAVTDAESAAIAQPETASGDSDRTADFKLPMDLLPTVDLDAAPEAVAQAPEETASEAAGEPEPAPEPASDPEPAAEAAHEIPSEAAAAPSPVDLDAEFDADDFLFGANGSTNGAGEPAMAATADSAEAPANALAAAPSPADEAASGRTSQAVAAPAAEVAADPLIPIKAMSPEERIALFS